MKLDPVREAAVALGDMATRLVERTEQVATTWTGLQGCYSSPEAPQVHALMVPAQTGAGEVSERLNGAKKALEDYVAALEGLRGRLKSVVSECETFRDTALDGVWLDATDTKEAEWWEHLAEVPSLGHYDRKVHVSWDQDGGMVRRNEDLINKYAAVVTAVTNAAMDCVAAIAALPGMPAELAGELPTEAVKPEEIVALWGDPATEDRSCMEQTGAGLKDFGTGILEGGGMLLLGYNPETGEFFSGEAYGQAWGGLGNLVGSIGVMAVYGTAVIVTGGQIANVSFGEDGDKWLHNRAVVVRDAGASLIGYDPYAPDGDGWHNWKDEPWRVGTSTVANIGTFFIPGAGAVGGAAKGASAVSKVTRLAGAGMRGAAELALPGGSWAVRSTALLGHGGSALLHGKGWSGALDAMRGLGAGGRPSAGAITAGTANLVSDLDKLTPPVHMSADVPSVSGSVRPLDGALPGVEPSGARLPAGNGLDPVDAGAPGSGSSSTRAVDGPAGAGEVSGSGAASSRAGAGRGAEGPSVLDDVEARESWLYQDAPVEPSAVERASGAQVSEPAMAVGAERAGGAQVSEPAMAVGAERAGGAQVSEPVREPAMAAVGAERAGQGSAAGRVGGAGGEGLGRSDGSPSGRGGGSSGGFDGASGGPRAVSGGGGPSGADLPAGGRGSGPDGSGLGRPVHDPSGSAGAGRAGTGSGDVPAGHADHGPAGHGAGDDAPSGRGMGDGPGAGHDGEVPGAASRAGEDGAGRLSEDGAAGTPGRVWDASDPVVRTVPAAEAPVRPSRADYHEAWDRSPVDSHGNHVDHRTGRPLDPKHYRLGWDPAGGRWIAESPDALAVPRSDVPTVEVMADYPRPEVRRTLTVAEGQVPGPRTPLVRFDGESGVFRLSDGRGLSPDTCYDVAGRGRFYTDSNGAVVRVETTSGGGGAGLNPDLNHPLPDVEYVVNGNTVFITDHLARTTLVDARGLVTVVEGPRSGYTQGLVGGEGRMEFVDPITGEPLVDPKTGLPYKYEGGHLLAAQLDGIPERINYVPMLEDINNARSALLDPARGKNFGTQENMLAQLIKDNPGAVVDYRVRPVFEGDSRVPVRIETEYRVDGGKWKEDGFPNVR